MKSVAVFLDRDGTVIEDRHYIGDPEDVHLLPGAAEAIRRFTAAGFRVIVVSNQSGLARGNFNQTDLDKVNARFEELLAAEGAHLDAVHYCPYLDGSEAVVADFKRKSELRKPMPGMLLKAAREMSIDLARSWMIGDSSRDIEAGKRAGCRTILVANGKTSKSADSRSATHRVESLTEAATMIEHDMKPAQRCEPALDEESKDREVIHALERIHDQLDRAHRNDRQQDFSVLRLFGALLQMFAVMAAIWGTMALLSGESSSATPRLLLACFLQLASISAFAIDRFR